MSAPDDPHYGTTPSTPAPPDTPGARANGETDDPEALREEIAQTREELGETVAALTDKSDVKAQATAKAEELKSKAQEVTETARAKAQDDPKPFVLAAAGALLVLAMLRRRRKRRRSAKLERLAGELAQRTLLVQAAPPLAETRR